MASYSEILPYQSWYQIVKTNPEKLPAALEFFETTYLTGYELGVQGGRLEELLKYHAGWLGYFDQLHTQLECIEALYVDNLDATMAEVLQEWKNNPPTNVAPSNATELKNMVQSDPRIVKGKEDLRDVRYWKDSYQSLKHIFEKRSFTLNNITSLRVHGLEEVEI